MFEFDQNALAYGVTALENRFLLDYLPAAKGDYVKVYVWGLHMCAWGKPEYSLEEMAQDLIMNVSEVEAALRYWERRGLVARLSDNPPAYRFYSPAQRALSPAAIAAYCAPPPGKSSATDVFSGSSSTRSSLSACILMPVDDCMFCVLAEPEPSEPNATSDCTLNELQNTSRNTSVMRMILAMSG